MSCLRRLWGIRFNRRERIDRKRMNVKSATLKREIKKRGIDASAARAGCGDSSAFVEPYPRWETGREVCLAAGAGGAE